MTATETVARRWFEEVWNQKREAAIDELLTPESEQRGEGGPVRGADRFKAEVYHPFLQLLPDIRLTIEDTLVCGDDVVVRWRAVGTHTGTAMGKAATGKPVSVFGMTWMKVQDGKLMVGWDAWNVGGLMAQLDG